jgi:hypothetical protein
LPTRELSKGSAPRRQGGILQDKRRKTVADPELHLAARAEETHVFFEDELRFPLRVDGAAEDFELFGSDHCSRPLGLVFIIIGLKLGDSSLLLEAA